MLKIRNLKVEVEGKLIIDGLNLNVQKGTVHAIMGPNGSGKSTICNAMMGNHEYQIKGGKIEFLGENIADMPTNEISKRGIFLIMQNPTEIPGVTNAELLRAAMSERGIKESIFEFNKHLKEACEVLHIDKSFIHRNINERMSGGEKKKNELLELYMLKPSLIILDELDSGLDVDSLKEACSFLNDYKEKTGATMIIITHHTNILNYIKPDKVHIISNGKIVEEGDYSLAEKIEKSGFNGAFNMSEVGTDE